MAEVTPQSIILGLPPLTFRGLVAPPYDTAPVSGGHRQAGRDFPYIDAKGHESVGRGAMQFSVKLYFLNSLEADLFPASFEKWRDKVIFNGKPGKLEHPVLGEFDVVPTTWNIEYTSEVQSGVIMTLGFEETVLDPEKELEVGSIVVSLKEAAEAADEARESLGIEWPTGERTDSLFDTIAQVEGLVLSARQTASGMVNQALGTVNNLIDTFEFIKDTPKWVATDLHQQVWTGLKDLSERIGIEDERPVGEHITRVRGTLGSIAEEVGNTVGEILTLNSVLWGLQSIPENTTVKFYKDTE